MAEAMDGGDVGAIQGLQGQQQPSLQPQPLLRIAGLQRPPVRQHLVLGLAAALHGGQGLLEAAGDAIPQFGRRRIGEGDHQQPLKIEGIQLATHQPQHQVGQGEGLARASTGLQQLHAGPQRQGIGVEVELARGSAARGVGIAPSITVNRRITVYRPVSFHRLLSLAWRARIGP